jgi:hypothetical protein
MIVTARNLAYFFAAGFAFLATAFFAGLALGAAFFAAGFFAPAFFFAWVAAAFPLVIGLSQQMIKSAVAHPHASSTATTNPHALQLSESPFFTFAIVASSFVCFKVDSA